MVVLLVFHAAAGDGNEARRNDAIEAAVALEADPLGDAAARRHHRRRRDPAAAARRRSAPSAWPTPWSAGDFLFSRAFALCGPLSSRR